MPNQQHQNTEGTTENSICNLQNSNSQNNSTFTIKLQINTEL